MDIVTVLNRLKANEHELRNLGIASLSLFGSTARGEARPDSDVDLAATFDESARIGLFEFADITERLRMLLDTPVDLVGEPARKPRMQAEIDRDRIRVF
ncbi:MAG: nucleotidyltransferase family protein [Sphingobium sp.]